MLPSAAERPPATVLDWETGAGKSYYIPAFEILGFSLALNLFDRLFLDEKTYSTDWRDWSRNLKDPSYQGSMNYGLARSAGLTYWDEMPAR